MPPFGKELLADVADRAVAEAVLGGARDTPTTKAEFEALVERGREHVVDRGVDIARNVRNVLSAVREVRSLLGDLSTTAFAPVRNAVTRQLAQLLQPGWVRTAPDGWWSQLPKYVRALHRRLDRARGDVARDAKLQALVLPYEAFLHKLTAVADAEKSDPERERLRWMIEEYRLSLFAQDMKTLMPISAKRLDEQVLLAQREAGMAPASVTAATRPAR